MATLRVTMNLTKYDCGFWTKPENYIEYMTEFADGIEKNGLRLAEETLEFKKKTGASDIDWAEEQVEYIKRKIKRYRNRAAKVAKQYGIA